LEEKYESVEKKNTDEETDEKCEKCGKPMLIKYGRFGKFMACSGFPECKNTKSLKNSQLTTDNKEPIKCPKCDEGNVVVKRTKRKRIFYGCSRWPACDFASWQNPAQENKKASN
jgi:DNA topoisomerase-1